MSIAPPKPLSTLPLTPKEQKIFEYLKEYWQNHQYSPTYEEIRDYFGFASLFSVQQYLKQLEKKGWIKNPGKNQKRAIQIASTTVANPDFSPQTLTVPLLGRVAAGLPIEALEAEERLSIPHGMVRPGGVYFALKVKGDSMIEEGILDQDFVIIRKQATAERGQTVVALVDGEATIKKYRPHSNGIDLIAANPAFPVIRVDPSQEFEIRGILAGVLRLF